MTSDCWIKTPLGNVVSLQRGHDLPNKDRRPGEVPVMGSSGITGYHDMSRADGPGVVIGRSGNSMGVISYSEINYWPLNTVLFVTDFKGNDPQFIYYLLKTINFDQFNSGSAQKSLNRNAVYPYEVFLPSDVETQRRIAGMLSSLESKAAVNHEINQTLEQMAQALFKSWFIDFEPVKAKVVALESGGTEADAMLAAMQAISGKSPEELTAFKNAQPEQYAELKTTAELFPSAVRDSELGEIPEGWEVSPFSQIAWLDTTSVNPGNSPDKHWEHYSIPAFDDGKTPAIEPGCSIKSNKYKVNPAAVLSSKLNPHFPRTWLPDVVEEEAAICSTEFMQFVPTDPKERLFVLGVVTSTPFQRGIAMRVTGSTGSRQRAQPKQVAVMDVVLPTKELVLEFSNQVGAMYLMQAKNLKQSQSLSSLRDTLLPKLLSGELTLPQANFKLNEVAHVQG